MREPKILVLPDPPAIAAAAAEQILKSSKAAIAERGSFSLVLSGGSTPKLLYKLLADQYGDKIDWDNVEIYFGDERCVPPTHEQSNYKMAYEAMLQQLQLPRERVHRIRGEIEPQAAAIEYGQLLKARFGDEGPDLVLLGMGDDGHTASLFPGTEALKETSHRCAANFVPKFNAWRVTMTAPFLNKAREVLVLVAGKDKALRLHEVLEGEQDPSRLPIQLIDPPNGQMTWLMDTASADMGP